jgi:hypothetical protein
LGNTFPTLVTHGDQRHTVVSEKSLQLSLILSSEFLESDKIDFGHDNHQRLVLEQRLDIVEEGDLLGDGLTTGFRNINEEKNGGSQMGQSSDSLHFDGVSLF